MIADDDQCKKSYFYLPDYNHAVTLAYKNKNQAFVFAEYILLGKRCFEAVVFGLVWREMGNPDGEIRRRQIWNKQPLDNMIEYG